MRVMIVCLGVFGALFCGPVVAQVAQWQVNQAGASLDVDGLTAPPGGGPVAATLFPGTAHSRNQAGASGQAFEIFLAPAPGVPSLLFTASGQIVNVDWSATPYTERLFLGSSFTILGDNWNQPGMPLPVINPNPGPQGGVPIYILAGTQNVTIERLEIHPGPWDSSLYVDGVTNATIQNYEFTNIDARNNIVSHVSFFTGRSTLPGGVWADVNGPSSQQLYSCVDITWTTRYFGAITEGIGGILLDPGYLSMVTEDYRLGPMSPCIDAGDPAILDADNSRSDMGCYGGPRGALPIGLF